MRMKRAKEMADSKRAQIEKYEMVFNNLIVWVVPSIPSADSRP